MKREAAKETTPSALRGWEWFALIAVLTLFVVQAAASSAQKSAAFDEEYHLMAGYAYLKTGDFRLSLTVGHPPLANLLSAIPLLIKADINLPLDHPAWANGDFQWFADTFLWQTNEDPQQILVLARLSIIALGLLTALVLFVWARQMAGRWAGWLALTLAVFDPNLLANSRLVTTDLGLTFFVLLTAWRLWRWLERPTRFNLILVGLSAGLAMATKYTGLLLWPIILVVLLIYPGFSWRRLFNLLIMGAVAYFVVWAVYRFDVSVIPDSGLPFPVPAPAYLSSAWQTFSYLREAPVPAYLLGQISSDGWWYYFPVTLAVKTPLPLLLLATAGLFTTLILHGLRCTVILWLPPAAYLALAMSGNFNIGYRHVLQIVPFLILLAAHSVLLPRLVQYWRAPPATPGARHEPALFPKRRLWFSSSVANPFSTVLIIALMLVMLAVWQVIATARIFPHHEAFFNELAGGPGGGSRVLVDSNIDWGQDLLALRELMGDMNIEQPYFAYFGSAPPENYGIDYLPLPGFLRLTTGPEVNAFNPYTPLPGWYAISETSLRLGLIHQNHDLYAFFQDKEPTARAGYSINLYQVTYPEDMPIDKTHVVGTAVADIDANQLGVKRDRRMVVTWSEGPETIVIPSEAFQAPHDLVEVGADFEGSFSLLGYTVDSYELRPGGLIELTLYWRTGTANVDTPRPASGAPLAAFVHLSGQDPGQILAQYDGWGVALTGLAEGDVIVQHVSLPVPLDVPPGDTFLRVGLYSPQSSRRLIAELDGELKDAIMLAPVGFQAPS